MPYTRLPHARPAQRRRHATRRTANIRPASRSTCPARPACALATSPVYDPQRYAIRRLVDNRVDTLDTIDVLQTGPAAAAPDQARLPGGRAHVDLDDARRVGVVLPRRPERGTTSATRSRSWSTTACGTSATATLGRLERLVRPVPAAGPGTTTSACYLDRPDRTNFYLGYRQTDPLNSKAVTGAVGYQLSRQVLHEPRRDLRLRHPARRCRTRSR